MAQGDWLENPELFARELRMGHTFAKAVGRCFEEEGLHVEVTPFRLAETVEERREFVDEHDLTIGRTRTVRIDVKSRRLRFSGPDDFPYQSVLVDTVSGWEAKTHKPAAIVCVSQLTEGMCVIPGSTYPLWTKAMRWDRVRRIQDTFFEVPRTELRPLGDLVVWLRTRTD